MPAGEIPNPDLDERVREKNLESVEFATTADRILGLLADEPLEIELKDGITLSFYPPTDEQFLSLVSLKGEAAQLGTKLTRMGVTAGLTDEEAEGKMPAVMELIGVARGMLNSTNDLLAALSVDKSWTSEKFKSLPRQYKEIILDEISGNKKKKLSKSKNSRRAPGE
jgi:hypothetical protein